MMREGGKRKGEKHDKKQERRCEKEMKEIMKNRGEETDMREMKE